MSDIAIRVENLSKQYRIGAAQTPYKTIRESLVEGVQAPFRRAAKLFRGEAYGASGMEEKIWALKDVSFEVKRGEVVGIIGRNGAGKTTLLKILSRITEPTEGRAEIHGRVGSLLEVGTGFHPELTGRENITLNGAILGMKRAEIDRKFDEIVAFAEIEKFMDTPVKRYSSGMYVRLAFAVAAHLEPEILLVDEVLAVGDAAFQKKCLGKMGDVAREGRTVLFVSHNMGAVSQLCSRCLLLCEGRVGLDGDATKVVQAYLVPSEKSAGLVLLGEGGPHGIRAFRFVSVRLLDGSGSSAGEVGFGEEFRILVDYEVRKRVPGGKISVELTNQLGVSVLTSSSADGYSRSEDTALEVGGWVGEVRIPARFLKPGKYSVSLGAAVPAKLLLGEAESVLCFEVVEDGTSPMFRLQEGRRGVVCPVFEWSPPVSRDGGSPELL